MILNMWCDNWYLTSKGTKWKINSEMLCTAGFSASVGPWLSEQSSLTHLHILRYVKSERVMPGSNLGHLLHETLASDRHFQWELLTYSTMTASISSLIQFLLKSAGLMIERLRVPILAGVVREFSSLESALGADSYSVSVPSLCYCTGT